jgi:hypothetical protein
VLSTEITPGTSQTTKAETLKSKEVLAAEGVRKQ